MQHAQDLSKLIAILLGRLMYKIYESETNLKQVVVPCHHSTLSITLSYVLLQILPSRFDQHELRADLALRMLLSIKVNSGLVYSNLLLMTPILIYQVKKALLVFVEHQSM